MPWWDAPSSGFVRVGWGDDGSEDPSAAAWRGAEVLRSASACCPNRLGTFSSAYAKGW